VEVQRARASIKRRKECSMSRQTKISRVERNRMSERGLSDLENKRCVQGCSHPGEHRGGVKRRQAKKGSSVLTNWRVQREQVSPGKRRKEKGRVNYRHSRTRQHRGHHNSKEKEKADRLSSCSAIQPECTRGSSSGGMKILHILQEVGIKAIMAGEGTVSEDAM
jgi:hypothetical protein